jgi:phosphoadenosine phosphosulfate reductase
LKADEVLRWAYAEHERVALVASFQAESGVLIDMACGLGLQPEVLTLDTGRLPEETHEVIEQFRRRYPIKLRVIQPDAAEVEAMTAEHGTNLFRQSVDLRMRCCDVRKSRPLTRTLSGYDAWITGLRREQAETRQKTPLVAPDPQHGGIAKIAPLAEWTKQQVWDYLREHDIPTHPLYAFGYTSIGCAPCTRATAPGEEERAGRWWWELGGVKECGLHLPTEVKS